MCSIVRERNKNNSKSQILGNDIMHGQIASFMENLKLSYKEAFEIIPYRNLIMMQQNKLRESYGEVIHTMSSREIAGNKIKG